MGMSAPAQAQAGTQYIGQISAFGFNFCPRGWASADGGLLAISSNSALFSIYGTSYGGDGRTTFGLPDLRGRRPIGDGSGPGLAPKVLGSKGGGESFTLTALNLPSHSHTGTLGASPTDADTSQPVRNSFAKTRSTNMFKTGAPAVNNMHPDTIRMNNAGGGQAVNKVSPYQTINWCVSTTGIFPSRN